MVGAVQSVEAFKLIKVENPNQNNAKTVGAVEPVKSSEPVQPVEPAELVEPVVPV